MIFKQWHDVLSGRKTQTRRLRKPDERGENSHGFDAATHAWNNQIDTVISESGIKKLQRSGSYAIQPGRGQESVGRFWLESIRLERVQDISAQDCIAEGLNTTLREQAAVDDLREQFQNLWDSIHSKRGTTWNDNPEVWVLEFRRTGI